VVGTITVLFSIFPLSVVFATVRPSEDTSSLFLVITVLAFVAAAIVPCEDTVTVHFVILPGTVVLATIRPGVLARAFNVVVSKLTSVGGSVSPVELSLTVLLSILVVTLVTGVVRPDFLALSVLLVLHPRTFVASAICVIIDTVAVGLVVFPFTVVNITVGVDEATTTISFVIFPVSFVEGTVNPDLGALAVLFTIKVPFALVLSAVIERLLWLGHTLLVLGVTFWGWRVLENVEFVADFRNHLLGFLDLSVRMCGKLALANENARLETIVLKSLATCLFTTNEGLKLCHSSDGHLIVLLVVLILVNGVVILHVRRQLGSIWIL